MQAWVCLNCGWTYDPHVGIPEAGVAPGTAFEDIPDDCKCPACSAAKADFELMDL